jgi:hypothetical protein
MGIEFGRGAFENPDDPMHGDDVDTTIVVVTAPADREAARRAVERCRERWRGIDGAGRHHGDDEAAFWDAQPDNAGPEWHTAKYVSDVVVEADGIVVDVDCKGLMPAAMRSAYRNVLVEELTLAGVEDAVVRSAYEADHSPVPDRPAGSWPPYADLGVPGLPSGIPPGHVIHHELRQRSDFHNWFLQRYFGRVWGASAAAVADCGEEQAVQRARRRFEDAGWRVGDVRATLDWDDKPVTAAAMTTPGAIALVTCQAARHLRRSGLPLPTDAEHVVIASAYYDLEPPS